MERDDVDVPRSVADHRLPVFEGVVLTVSGIGEVGRRMDVHRELVAEKGTYVKQIVRPVRVTHLLCGNESEAENCPLQQWASISIAARSRRHLHPRLQMLRGSTTCWVRCSLFPPMRWCHALSS